jgi:hypothetical protein
MMTEDGCNRIDNSANAFQRQGQDGKLVPIRQLRSDHITVVDSDCEKAERTLIDLILQCGVRHPVARVDERDSSWIARNRHCQGVVQEPIGPPPSGTIPVGILASEDRFKQHCMLLPVARA